MTKKSIQARQEQKIEWIWINLNAICSGLTDEKLAKNNWVFTADIRRHITEEDVAFGKYKEMFKPFAEVFCNGDETLFRKNVKLHTGIYMNKCDTLPRVIVDLSEEGLNTTGGLEKAFANVLVARIIEMCRKLKFLLRGAKRSNKCLQNKLEDSLVVNTRLREELLSSDTKLNKMIEQVRRTLEISKRDLEDRISRLEEENAKLIDCINEQEKGLNWFNAYGRLKKLYKEVEHIKGKKHGI